MEMPSARRFSATEINMSFYPSLYIVIIGLRIIVVIIIVIIYILTRISSYFIAYSIAKNLFLN